MTHHILRKKTYSAILLFILLLTYFQSTWAQQPGNLLSLSKLPKTQANKFNFIVLGDTHLGSKMAEEPFQEIVKQINYRMPSFVINTGDNIDVDEPNQWKIFNELTSKIKVPFFTAIGNHDSYISNRLYLKNRGPLYYSFDYGNSHFIILDNAQNTNNATLYIYPQKKSEQWDWLVKDINSNAIHKFVFFHFPVFGKRSMLDPQYNPFTSQEERKTEVEKMIKLFKENGVKYVCFGHIHDYKREEIDGIIHLRSGGGGGSETSKTVKENIHFVHFFVDDKSIKDIAVFIYGEFSKLEFVNPINKLTVGDKHHFIVDGVVSTPNTATDSKVILNSGKHIATIPKFSVDGLIGEISPEGIFEAKKRGKGKIIAEKDNLKAEIGLLVE